MFEELTIPRLETLNRRGIEKWAWNLGLAVGIPHEDDRQIAVHLRCRRGLEVRSGAVILSKSPHPYESNQQRLYDLVYQLLHQPKLPIEQHELAYLKRHAEHGSRVAIESDGKPNLAMSALWGEVKRLIQTIELLLGTAKQEKGSYESERTQPPV